MSNTYSVIRVERTNARARVCMISGKENTKRVSIMFDHPWRPPIENLMRVAVFRILKTAIHVDLGACNVLSNETRENNDAILSLNLVKKGESMSDL